MDSGFLTKMGLSGVDAGLVLFILIILIFILFVACIVLTVELCKLTKRYNKFCQGRNAKSMEKEISEMFIENSSLRDISDSNKKDIRTIFRRLESAYQKIGIVKYDAFSQMGGKLSFALCVLNENNDGFILNSVYGNDGSYTYLKEIKKGACEITLGKEEEQALKTAMHE